METTQHSFDRSPSRLRQTGAAFLKGFSARLGFYGEPLGGYRPIPETSDQEAVEQDMQQALGEINEALRQVMNKQQMEE